jgi:hypothetical protein
MINHPYLKNLQSTLNFHKKLLECLEKRLVLIHTDYALKNEYEKNEIEITKIKTQSEIDSIKKVIHERESYFQKYMNKFVADAEEVDKNYSKVLADLKKNKDKISGAKELLDAVNWKAVEENLEVKIKLYERLKNLSK